MESIKPTKRENADISIARRTTLKKKKKNIVNTTRSFLDDKENVITKEKKERFKHAWIGNERNVVSRLFFLQKKTKMELLMNISTSPYQ